MARLVLDPAGLRATDGLGTKTTGGVPSDGNFAATPTDGYLAVDTTNNALYFRSGAVWRAAGGASSGSLISSADIAFTDGDTSRRVTITDSTISATDNIICSVRRPDTVDDSADRGYIYVANVVEVNNGSFDVLISATAWGFEDPTQNPPNETVKLLYSITVATMVPNWPLLAPLGSATAPPYSFTGDTNTGIYSPGADQVAITTGGTQRLLVDAAGTVSLSSSLYVSGSNVVAYAGTAGAAYLGGQGPGGEAGIRLGLTGDTNLYRSGAANLKTDSTLTVAGSQLNFSNNGAVLLSNQSSDTNASFLTGRAGEAQAKFSVYANGQINWGPGGSTTQDTFLYRNGVNALRTAGTLTVDSTGQFGGGIALVQNTATTIDFYHPTAGSGLKRSRIISDAGYVYFQNLDDAYTTGYTAMRFEKGTTPNVAVTNSLYAGLQVAVGPEAGSTTAPGSVANMSDLQTMFYLNGTTPNSSSYAISFQSGGGGAACIGMRRDGGYGTYIDFYTNNASTPTATKLALTIDNTGRLLFGQSGDVDLYRAAADILQTDDSLVVSRYLYASFNASGTYPLVGGASVTGWNFSGGSGEVNNWNGYTGITIGDGTPAFMWHQLTGSSAKSDLMQLSSSGALTLLGANKMYFGSAQDTNLYRSAANVLKTDDSLAVVGSIYADNSGAGSALFFGSAADANLYRANAGVLQTDGVFIAAGGRVNLTDITNGAVELGGLGNNPGAQQPYIDFHYAPAGTFTAQDFNMRIQNIADKALQFSDNTNYLEVNGAAGGSGKMGLLINGDTNLFRYAADILATDDAFLSQPGGGVSTAIGIRYTGASNWTRGFFATGIYWDGTQWSAPTFGGNNGWSLIAGDGANSAIGFYMDPSTGASNRTYTEVQFAATLSVRMAANVGGSGNPGIQFGSASDTNLYRSGSNVLKTDGSMLAAPFQATSTGAASAPAFSFVGDTDVGMYSSSPNSVDFSAGNVRRLQLNATGIGFFNTTPAARQTGYGSGTQVGTKAALTSASTLNDVIAVLSSLVADLRTYGLIGS